MRGLLLVLAVAGLVGCEKSDPVPAQVQLNPGGAPRSAKEQATMDARREAGDRSNQEMAAAAQQMAAAKARAGGK